MSGPLRIGMVGGGTVGGGVYEIIMGRLGGSNVNSDSGNSSGMVITKICVRDVLKPRDFHVDDALTEVVSDVRSILDDNDIDMVVEVMGGVTLARDVVLDALSKGKHVVTANKALIAEHLPEIERAVSVAQVQSPQQTVSFGYEAAVCGGIPIIHTLQTSYTGDIIHEIMGICNGTTNYMLTKMEQGADYQQVLEEAQELGYAEADPTADVEGHDVRAKIAILAKLGFDTSVPIDNIPTMGISQISKVDFEYAKLLNCTIKLVGTASRLSQYGEHDGPLTVYVAPKVLPLGHLLAQTSGSANAVAVTSANLGTNAYTGPGAGRFPTANSVVADICRIAGGIATPSPFSGSVTATATAPSIDNDYTSAFYIRIPYQDSLGIIRIVGELCEKHGVSINSVLQNPITDRMAADFCLTTEECKLSQVQALCNDIKEEEFARDVPLCMPMLLMDE